MPATDVMRMKAPTSRVIAKGIYVFTKKRICCKLSSACTKLADELVSNETYRKHMFVPGTDVIMRMKAPTARIIAKGIHDLQLWSHTPDFTAPPCGETQVHWLHVCEEMSHNTTEYDECLYMFKTKIST